jgi:hypothetical protein
VVLMVAKVVPVEVLLQVEDVAIKEEDIANMAINVVVPGVIQMTVITTSRTIHVVITVMLTLGSSVMTILMDLIIVQDLMEQQAMVAVDSVAVV